LQLCFLFFRLFAFTDFVTFTYSKGGSFVSCTGQKDANGAIFAASHAFTLLQETSNSPPKK